MNKGTLLFLVSVGIIVMIEIVIPISKVPNVLHGWEIYAGWIGLPLSIPLYYFEKMIHSSKQESKK